MFKVLKIPKSLDSPSFLHNFGGKKGMCVCCGVGGSSWFEKLSVKVGEQGKLDC